MDFVFLSTILGLITSLVTLTIWSWSLIGKLRTQVALARTDAEQGKALAEELVSSATSAEKRADIYVYVTLKAVESSERRSTSSISNGVITIITLLIVFAFAWANKTLEINYKHPLMIVLYLAFPALLFSWGAMNWYDRLLRMLEDGWQSGVNRILSAKVYKHVP